MSYKSHKFGLLAKIVPFVLIRHNPAVALLSKMPNPFTKPPNNCLILPNFLFLFLIIRYLLCFNFLHILNMAFLQKQNFRFFCPPFVQSFKGFQHIPFASIDILSC